MNAQVPAWMPSTGEGYNGHQVYCRSPLKTQEPLGLITIELE